MYHPSDDGFDGRCMAPGCSNWIDPPAGRPRRRRHPDEQPGIDGRSIRDQRRTCSDRCRKALSRSRQGEKATYRTCALCGQLFLARGRGGYRRSICPYDDADDYCAQLQDELDDTKAERAYALENAICEGPGCDGPIPYSGRGRPSKFCSPRCRTRSYRSKKGA